MNRIQNEIIYLHLFDVGKEWFCKCNDHLTNFKQTTSYIGQFLIFFNITKYLLIIT